MNKQFHVRLTNEERKELKRLVETGRKLARRITRARVLLLADCGKSDKEIAEALQITTMTVYNVRKRFLTQKSLKSLEDKPRPGQPAKLVGLTAAHITALACSEPPEGRDRWTLRLLADKSVKLDIVDSVSHEGIRKLLKKTN